MTVTVGRRVATLEELERPGDYCLAGPRTSQDSRAVWFLLPIHEGENRYDRPTPGSGLHRVTEPPWTFRECADGSVEVRASIACGRGSEDGEYWHGFLDEGHVWRQV